MVFSLAYAILSFYNHLLGILKCVCTLFPGVSCIVK